LQPKKRLRALQQRLKPQPPVLQLSALPRPRLPWQQQLLRLLRKSNRSPR
jgi:hypothetical protein